jgi:hypothetical protein
MFPKFLARMMMIRIKMIESRIYTFEFKQRTV